MPECRPARACVMDNRQAAPSRIDVRVVTVLSFLSTTGGLRIRDLSENSILPQANARLVVFFFFFFFWGGFSSFILVDVFLCNLTLSIWRQDAS